MTEKEFTEKYCKECGSQRCGGVSDEKMRSGCLTYNREFLNKEPLVYKGEPSIIDHLITLEPEPYSLELKLGNMTINIRNTTLTEEQIKNYKDYFNIDARNLL